MYFPSSFLSFVFLWPPVHLSHFFHSLLSVLSHCLCTPGLTPRLADSPQPPPPHPRLLSLFCPLAAQMISALSSHPIDFCGLLTPSPFVCPTRSILPFLFSCPATTHTRRAPLPHSDRRLKYCFPLYPLSCRPVRPPLH